MSSGRAARTARGAVAACAATLFAAMSHAFAGGSATPLAVGATAIVALPICVLLAGRLGSLWRLSLAVALSQLPYHWTFWGLWLSAGAGSSDGFPNHATHLATVFTPAAVASGTADTWMWISHLFAAIATIALLHSGERAAIAIAGVLRRAFPRALPRAIALPSSAAARPRAIETTLRERLTGLSAISHRGPPLVPAPALIRR